MSEDLIKLHEERLEIENRIYSEINRISEIVNTYTKDGDEIEIIANTSYKLQVAEGDILIMMDTGSVFFRDLRISTEYQLVRLVLERREEILSKFIEFNERMIKMGKNITESYLTSWKSVLDPNTLIETLRMIIKAIITAGLYKSRGEKDFLLVK